MPKFSKGDILTCKYKLKKKVDGVWITKNDCRVRVTKVTKHKARFQNRYLINYNVYNIDFDRYEIIGEFYLDLDIQQNREDKLRSLLE